MRFPRSVAALNIASAMLFFLLLLLSLYGVAHSVARRAVEPEDSILALICVSLSIFFFAIFSMSRWAYNHDRPVAGVSRRVVAGMNFVGLMILTGLALLGSRSRDAVDDLITYVLLVPMLTLVLNAICLTNIKLPKFLIRRN